MTNPLQEAIAHHAAGRLDEARQLYLRIPAGDPQHAEALHLLGVIAGQQADYRRAIDLIAQSLRLNPGNAASHYDQGLAYKELGEAEAALASFDRAIELQPERVDAHSSRALLLRALGRRDEAVESFREAIRLNAASTDSHYNLGLTLHELGRVQEAVFSYDLAIGLQPQLARAYYNRGTAYRDLGRPADALRDYEKALTLEPGNASAHAYRGVALLSLRQPEAALESCNRALEIDRNLAEAWQARGAVNLELRRNEAALADLDTALRLRPKALAPMFLRARALMLLGRVPEGLEVLERAAQMAPGSADAHMNLALALEARDPPRALLSYERARKINPNLDYVDGAILHLKQILCDWTTLEEETSRVAAKIGLGRPAASPLTVLAATDDPEVQLKAAQIFVRHRNPPNSVLGPLPKRRSSAPIRVGYFSADFRDHAVSHLSAAIFEAHDRARVQPMGFAFGPKSDDGLRRRVRAALDPFVDLHDLTNVEAARRAREFDLDIAVDLGGLTQYARTGIFAARVAPIQVAYLGYLGSMGAPFIDYILADEVLIPDGDRGHYSEKVAYLPSYQTSDAVRENVENPTHADLELPRGSFTFCCLNNSYKISPSMFDCWIRILDAVPHSVLVLSATNAVATGNVQREARARGIDAARLRFWRPCSRPEYLARLKTPDLFLDTFPYSAGTVANDAVWAGLPVVTLAGRSFAARMAASVLTSAGLADLVAHDEDAYVARAVELATMTELMEKVRSRVAHARDNSLLFDPPKFTPFLEGLFEKMLERHQRGEQPDHLPLQRR